MSKIINNGTKRAIRDRLQIILEEEEKNFKDWKESNRPMQVNATRRKQVERNYNKRIQSLKIVIYYLTPYLDRDFDEPMFVVKKTTVILLLLTSYLI